MHVVWHFSFDKPIVVLDTERFIKLIPDLEDFIHGCATVRHPWVDLDFVGLLVDVLVGVFATVAVV